MLDSTSVEFRHVFSCSDLISFHVICQGCFNGIGAILRIHHSHYFWLRLRAKYIQNIMSVNPYSSINFGTQFDIAHHNSTASCKKGPTRHAYAWQIGPFWQDTFEMRLLNYFLFPTACLASHLSMAIVSSFVCAKISNHFPSYIDSLHIQRSDWWP